MKFIEFTDKDGRKMLVNLSQVERIIDRNKTIEMVMGENTYTLSLAYSTLKSWLLSNESPILQAGNAL